MLRPFRLIPLFVLSLLAAPASAITVTFDCITGFGISKLAMSARISSRWT